MEKDELSQKNIPPAGDQNIESELSEKQKEIAVLEVPEQESSLSPSEIDSKIKEKTGIIEDTTQKIGDLREKLGLLPSSDVSHSVKIEKGKIDAFNKLKEEALEKESQEEIKKFERAVKNTLETISSGARTMLDALGERQQNRLTPLQSNESFHGMASLIKNLGNFSGKIDTNSIEEIIMNIRRLNGLFGDMRIQKTATVREDPQNLEKLVFGVIKFSASAQEGGSKLPIEMQNKQMEGKSKELRKNLSTLFQQTQNLSSLAVKMRSHFR